MSAISTAHTPSPKEGQSQPSSDTPEAIFAYMTEMGSRDTVVARQARAEQPALEVPTTGFTVDTFKMPDEVAASSGIRSITAWHKSATAIRTAYLETARGYTLGWLKLSPLNAQPARGAKTSLSTDYYIEATGKQGEYRMTKPKKGIKRVIGGVALGLKGLARRNFQDGPRTEVDEAERAEVFGLLRLAAEQEINE